MEDKVYGSDDEWVWAEKTVTKIGAPASERTTSPMQPPAETISSQKSKLLCQTGRDVQGVENLCLLNSMDERNILINLQKRFHCKFPYTSANDICIAFNPYSSLNIYDEGTKHCYAVQPLSALPAHIFALSRASYDGMRSDRRNQSLLVSGESGAGKTESVKVLLDHIAFSAAVQSGSAEKNQLFEKILMANPLLESFGNAKTSRNFNSSRFGKYVKLHFDTNSELQRSTCTTYLLEKSRVVNPPSGDSNFHIFHEMLAAPEAVRTGLYLSGMTAADFAYTAQVMPSETEHAMYAARFLSTCRAFKEVLGISEEVLQRVLAVLAGVLYLGQLQLLPAENGSNSHGHSHSHGHGDSDGGITNNSYALDDAALAVCSSLLQVEAAQLHQSLTTRLLITSTTTSTGSSSSGSSHSHHAAAAAAAEAIRTTLSRSQALLARDALAKEVYARLFAWMVTQVNDSTHLHDEDDTSQDVSTPLTASTSTTTTTTTSTTTTAPSFSTTTTTPTNNNPNPSYSPATEELTISLLDIFGFENFTSSAPSAGSHSHTKGVSSSCCSSLNGFEQLCINYCNEKLQHMFTNDVIVEVQQEFAREGLTTMTMMSQVSSSTSDSSDAFSLGIGAPTVLRLFEHRSSGLINLLNEECIVPGGCESSFLTKLIKSNSNNASSTSCKPNSSGGPSSSFPLQAVPFSTTHFTVHHYADSVTYSTQSFIEKNRDTLPLLAAQLLATSENNLLATLFSDMQGGDSNNSNSEGGLSVSVARPNKSSNASVSISTGSSGSGSGSSTSKRAPVTTLGKFRAQLDSLLSTVQATRCRYIRCLKPNSEKSSTVFDSSLVLQQLRSGGVVQAVEVSRAAYPHKMTHRECLQRYRGCWGHKWTAKPCGSETKDSAYEEEILSTKRACEELWQCAEVVSILSTAAASVSAGAAQSPSPPSVQVGHTMVYFAAGVLEALDISKQQYLHRRVVPIQSTVRAWLQRKRYLKALTCVVTVQAAARRYRARTQYRMCRLAVTVVQQWYRARKQRRRDRRTVRGMLAQWARCTRTVNKLRALVQTAAQYHHLHRHSSDHDNQDHQQQDQDQDQKQDEDQEDSTSDWSLLLPSPPPPSQQKLHPPVYRAASVNASTQTADSSLLHWLSLHCPCACACPSCGQDPRMPLDIPDLHTHRSSSTTSTSTSTSTSTMTMVASEGDAESALAIAIATTTLIADTDDSILTFDEVQHQSSQQLPPQHQQAPCNPKLMKVLRALGHALREEWDRSLLQDIKESIDLRTALAIAAAAVLGSTLSNDWM